MTNLEVYDFAHSQILINKVTAEMMMAAKFLAIDNGGTPTSNQKAFALQSFLNPKAHVEPFIWGCALDGPIQAAGTAVTDGAIASKVASLWPTLWA